MLMYIVSLVECKVKALGGNKRDSRWRLAKNFSGLGSEWKRKEVGELLAKNNIHTCIDVVVGQES